MSSLDQGPRGRRGPPGSFGEKGLVGAQVGLTNSRLNTAAHSPRPVRRPVCPWTNNVKIHGLFWDLWVSGLSRNS